MKKWIFLLAFCLLCQGAVCYGAAKEYAGFTLSVPDDWTEQKFTDDAYEFRAPDNSARVGVALLKAADGDFDALAREVAQALNAELDKDEDGDYTAEYEKDGKQGNLSMTREGDRLLVISVLGEHPHLEGIMDSIEVRKP